MYATRTYFYDGKLFVRDELDDKIYRIRNMKDFERLELS